MKINTLFKILIPILLFGIGSVGFAGTEGKITGVVIDKQTRDPISDVNIFLKGTELGAATDLDGYYVILNVPPGNYDLMVQYLGYQSQMVEGLVVISDLTTVVNFELEETTLEIGDAVVVTADKPLIRPDVTSKLAVVDGREISTMPVDNINEVIASQAGITTDAQGNLHLRGGRTNEVIYLVDGQPVQNPLDNSLGGLIDNYAIRELQVLSGTFNAEYGSAMSGIINIVTNDGSDQFRTKVEYTSPMANSSPYRKPNALVPDANPFNLENNRLQYQETDALEIIDPIFPNEGNFNGFFSGALPKGLGTYFFSGEYKNENSWLPHGYNFIRSGFGKITLPIGSGKLAGSVQYSDQQSQAYSHQFKYLPQNQGHWENKSKRYAAKYNHTFSKNSFLTLNVSMLDYQSLYTVNDLFYTDYIFPELDGSLEFVIAGNSKSYTDFKSITYNAKADWLYQLNRNHEFKSGFEFNLYDLDVFDYSNEGNNPEDFFLNEFQNKPVTASAYLQDKIEYRDLIINAGVRGDYVDAEGESFRNIEDPGGGLVANEPELKLSPRLGMAYPVSENSVLHFSYGHFLQFPNFQEIYSNLQFLNPDILETATIALIGNPNVKSMKTVAYEFGVAQKISDHFAMNVTAYSKDISDLLGTRDVTTGTYRYIIFINNDFARIQGVDITLEKRITNYWSAKLDYTYSIARGNESTPLEEAYNIYEGQERSVKELYLDFDRRHDIAFNFLVSLPAKFGPRMLGMSPLERMNLFVLGEFSSGLPYTPSSDDFTKRFEKNSGRMGWTNTVDVRLEKFIPFYAFTFSMFLEVTNLFDRLNPLVVQTRTGKLWDDGKSTLFGSGEDFKHNPAQVGPPRIIKFGVSIAR